MATDRKFAGFQRNGAPPFRMSEITKGGMCLSSFLIITNSSGRVLMGKLDPGFGWDHVGALDDMRKERHSMGWMLPSCHLLIGESPAEAARRVAGEQLGLGDLELSDPSIFSETYTPAISGEPAHWDLEFIFRGSHNAPVSHPAWRQLEYVDPNAPDAEFARNHQDILRSAGLRR